MFYQSADSLGTGLLLVLPSDVQGDEVHTVIGRVVQWRTLEVGEREMREKLLARTMIDDVTVLIKI